MLWDHSTDSKAKTATAGARQCVKNASCKPVYLIFCGARDRPRAEVHLGLARRAAFAAEFGDLRRQGVQETGRHGLPAEAVLRCALLKQYRQLSYEELAFHLEDSASFRAFARL